MLRPNWFEQIYYKSIFCNSKSWWDKSEISETKNTFTVMGFRETLHHIYLSKEFSVRNIFVIFILNVF